MFELALWLGIGFTKAAEGLVNFSRVQGFTGFATARDCPDLVAAFAADLPRFGFAAEGSFEFLARLETVDFDLGRRPRVIFDMIRVY